MLAYRLQVDALQARVDSLSEESAQLQHELHEARSRVAELEASLAKSDMRCDCSSLPGRAVLWAT